MTATSNRTGLIANDVLPDQSAAESDPSVDAAALSLSIWRGALAGLISASVGLGAGELTAGLFKSLSSPIISVGDKAIDLVPVPLKNFAIRTFGTHDKQALLAGIGAAIVVFAAVVGIVATRRRMVGVAGLVAFGGLGAAAAVSGRTGTAGDAIPSTVAAAVAIGSLLTLIALLGRATRLPLEVARVHSQEVAPPRGASLNRRSFLIGSSSMAAAAAVFGGLGRSLQSASGAVASRARSLVAKPKVALPAAPTTISAEALKVANPFFTPNKDFYRIDTALVVPKIDSNSWKLSVKGMVGEERTYTYDELLGRNLIERDITLTCVSNEVGGILMGTARWVGVPLRELLDEARADSNATQIVGRSVDGWTSGFPVSAALDRDAMVALAMNGEPLPFTHGFPARLVVPGLYGYVSATKWLTEIELTTMEAFDSYWVPRGYAKEAPIKLASRIDVPRGLASIPVGPAAIAGVAWSQTVGISKVELSIDSGDWFEANLATAQSKDTWRQWSYKWDAPAGRHDIAVRATDANGKLQIEERTAPLPNGATGWHSIIVLVS
jgi:DMSO/TMAO reductase YedYZ molybdopterin-dependent catalytic subunit